MTEENNKNIETKIKDEYYSGNGYYKDYHLRLENIFKILLGSLEGKVIVNYDISNEDAILFVRYLRKKLKANAYGFYYDPNLNELISYLKNEMKNNKFKNKFKEAYNDIKEFIKQGILKDRIEGGICQFKFKKNTVDLIHASGYECEEEVKDMEKALKVGGYALAFGVDAKSPSIIEYSNKTKFKVIADWWKPDPAGGWYSGVIQKIKD